jgi:penicillin amidase
MAMRPSVALGALALTALTFSTNCRRSSPTPPLEAQLSGTIELPGLSAAVRVVRDRWGVPHVYAGTRDDLFAAQGFVQAQDRLFQMDLWRRAAQGRLAEVLGPNFIERDAMTRRIEYRGDLEREWASYAPDTRAIATAFTRGINAWVARARERPPEEFVLAGWKPDFWSPEDLLTRTDAFVESRDRVGQSPRNRPNQFVADALRRVGTAPFFAGLAAAPDPLQLSPRSAGRLVATHDRLEVSEPGRRFDHPSIRYFIHLVGPGWNVVGATAPWLPGVAVGHNERAAWGMAAIDADTQDVSAEPADPSTSRFVADPITVKGRTSPFSFDRELTPRGAVVATDREHGRVFVLRWSGTEPGAAPSLAALALDRADTWLEFRRALAGWKMPARRVVYADRDGTIATQDAALVPRRRGRDWTGWLTLDELPHAVNPRGSLVSAGPSAPVEGQGPAAVYLHVLGVTAAARRRFNIGPIDRPGGDDSPTRAVFNLLDWDRSQALNAPGQSESADSPHFADQAALWSAGRTFPLVFSEAAVEANTGTTLTLVPSQRTR